MTISYTQVGVIGVDDIYLMSATNEYVYTLSCDEFGAASAQVDILALLSAQGIDVTALHFFEATVSVVTNVEAADPFNLYAGITLPSSGPPSAPDAPGDWVLNGDGTTIVACDNDITALFGVVSCDPAGPGISTSSGSPTASYWHDTGGGDWITVTPASLGGAYELTVFATVTDLLGNYQPDAATVQIEITQIEFAGTVPGDDPDIYLDVTTECEIGGFGVVVSFSGNVPSDATWTLYREDGFGEQVVRGAQDVSVSSTAIFSIIDYESSITTPVTYHVVVKNNAGTVVFEESVTKLALSATCGAVQYLRDMLDPEVHFTSSFCLGTIDQTESTVSAGVFNALGRPAPVVVVDTRETETGTLRFISRTKEELTEIRRLFTRGTPMLLQIGDDYNLGRSGVLYFQPTKFVDRWLAPNARLPYHTIEVSYTVVDAPAYAAVFQRFGIPYDVPITASPGYTITVGDLVGRSYCDGGVLQRYTSYDDLIDSGESYTSLYFSTDSCAG